MFFMTKKFLNISKRAQEAQFSPIRKFVPFLEEVKKQGVRRAEWVVLDWNQNAIDFYEKYGASILRDWHLVQIDNQTIMKNSK